MWSIPNKNTKNEATSSRTSLAYTTDSFQAIANISVVHLLNNILKELKIEQKHKSS